MGEEVHKDFHGALSYGLEFLEEQYDAEGVHEFLAGLASTVYKDLVDALRRRGLPALEEHWERVFRLEGGEFEMNMEGDALALDVRKCPAIHHMREREYRVARRFCEHTRIVNEAICGAAGYESSVDYDQEKGRCVQRFWRVGA